MKRRQEEQDGSTPNSKRQEVSEEDRPSDMAAASNQYLQYVKQAFNDNSRVYVEFIGVLQDYKARRITVPELVATVKVFFKDHPELILGFNTFLPRDYKMKVEDIPKRPVDYGQALKLVRKIKAKFHPDECSNLVKTLLKFRDGLLSSQDVREEVADQLRNYPDLLAGFMGFLPENNVAHYLQQVETLEDDIDDVKCSSEEHDDPGYLACIDIRSNQGHRKKLEREEDRDNREQNQLVSVQERDRAERNTCPTPLVEILNGLWKKVDDLNLIKGELNMGESFQELWKCLHMYSDGLITGEDLRILAAVVLQKCPELVALFNNFVRHCEIAELSLISLEEQEGLREEAGTQDIDQRADLERERYVEQEKESEKHVSRDVPSPSSDSSNKTVSALDLLKCEQCTPSYRLLPEANRLPKSGFRTPLGHAVLNDTWVSVTSGSEDFKHTRKNAYEESLFRCDDDRFELDMILQPTNATINRLEELLKKVKESNSEEDIHIDDHLTAIHLRCIERIYGSHGLEVIDELRQRPGAVLPVVLNRLKQKHNEWLKYQADMNKIWAEAVAKIYQKSLDDRSFHSKQQDTN